MNSVRIGTRGSELALWQARRVQEKLAASGVRSELHLLKTTGDRHADVPLSSIGGTGMFIKELEEALVRDEVDLAVHSLKDVPSLVPPEFELAGFLERGDPRDAWFHPDGLAIERLPEGSLIGTSAPRRRAQLRTLHPRLRVVALRGNVPTRLQKMRDGLCAGLVLAAAGVTRLGREREITSRFEADQMIPAAGQGIVGLEILRRRDDMREIVRGISDADAELAAECERGVLQQFGTLLDCYSAVAVHARLTGDQIRIDAFFSDPEGEISIRDTIGGSREDHGVLVRQLADRLKQQGALDLLGARDDE